MNRSIKRITKDILDLRKTPLTDSQIFVSYDETNMYKLYVLMIGTEDTPYHGGFYLFDFTFTDLYPMKPPSVKFCTLDGKVRFNPNLYVDGKVCLSILGTWSGPQWSPMNSITTILLAIQAMVLVKYPMTNEPGFENSDPKTLEAYNDVIRHENFNVAVIQILNNLAPKFETFRQRIELHFIKNIETYRNQLIEYATKYDDCIVKSPAYGMTIKCEYIYMLEQINSLYDKLCPKYVGLDFIDALNVGKCVVQTLEEENSDTCEVKSMDEFIPDSMDESDDDVLEQHDVNKKTSMYPSTVEELSCVDLDWFYEDMKKLAISLDIELEKKSKSTGNMIRKTKKDLMKDFSTKKIEHKII